LADIKVNGVVDCLLNTVIHESINKGAAMISSMVMPNSVYKSAFRKKLIYQTATHTNAAGNAFWGILS